MKDKKLFKSTLGSAITATLHHCRHYSLQAKGRWVMRKIVVIVAIFISLFAGKALAAGAFKTGNDLYAMMTSEDYIDRVGAMRYVQGAYDTIITMSSELRTDIPDGLETRQVTDIVKLYLEKHPEERHKQAALHVINALDEAFSTKK